MKYKSKLDYLLALPVIIVFSAICLRLMVGAVYLFVFNLKASYLIVSLFVCLIWLFIDIKKSDIPLEFAKKVWWKVFLTILAIYYCFNNFHDIRFFSYLLLLIFIVIICYLFGFLPKEVWIFISESRKVLISNYIIDLFVSVFCISLLNAPENSWINKFLESLYTVYISNLGEYLDIFYPIIAFFVFLGIPLIKSILSSVFFSNIKERNKDKWYFWGNLLAFYMSLIITTTIVQSFLDDKQFGLVSIIVMFLMVLSFEILLTFCIYKQYKQPGQEKNNVILGFWVGIIVLLIVLMLSALNNDAVNIFVWVVPILIPTIIGESSIISSKN